VTRIKGEINKLGIRRMTPIEWERLQGFPDGWTEGVADGQRYRQLGNSVSVPVIKAVSKKLIQELLYPTPYVEPIEKVGQVRMVVHVKRNLRRKLRICSLFSGCGGMDLGMVGGFEFLGVKYPKTGLKIVWAADNDADAVKTLRANKTYFGQHPIFEGDLSDFDGSEIVPEFDILTAGFPCQPFSNAGDRGGVDDKHGRGMLFEVCEDLVRSLDSKRRPLAFVFENVKGILSSAMPNNTTVAEEITKRMRRLGYECQGPQLLKAEDYGVPQQRHRVFFVGIRKDLGVVFDFDKLKKYVQPKSMELRHLKHSIAGISHLPDSNEVWGFSPQARYMIPMIKRSWKDIEYEKLPERFKKIRNAIVRYRAPNFYRRFGWDEINGTITASAMPENCGIIHPKENRRYSVREIARIQSFPDDFIFEARRVQNKYKIIGNAVPPILGYVIARALMDTIKGAPKWQRISRLKRKERSYETLHNTEQNP
jgi:DNA (cytosine-5)-methyltransferase 1